MRKVSTLLCVAMVLYAIPAFGERISPKARNVDRTQLTIKSTDSLTKTAISEGRTANTVGVAYSNMNLGDAYVSPAFCSGACIVEDYDSVIDKPFVQGNFGFVGGVSMTGVMWITMFDSVGSFMTSGGWYFGPGLFIYSMDFVGKPAADAGFVQFYPDPGYISATTATVITDVAGPEVGTTNPGPGFCDAGAGTLCTTEPNAGDAYFIELTSIEVGVCCGALHGDCTGPMAEGSCGGTFVPGGVCAPNTCPAGSCGNGVLEPANGEQCDDGNLTPGDDCDQNCQIELTFVPAVSEWGLLVMALLGLTVGTVLFGRRRAIA